MKSDGSAWRPVVHAEDMALAFKTALEADRDLVHCQAFNVGRNEDCMQVRDIAKIIGEEIPEAEITFAPKATADARTYQVDCSKIKGIGYRPQWNLRRGVRQLRDGFRDFGVSVEEFEGSRYQRLAHVRQLIAEDRITSNLTFLAENAA
jgi:nucleoside-diphosphate-sugar epimerase